jgi:hypothetical protein
MKENIIGIVPDARKRNARVKSSVFVVFILARCGVEKNAWPSRRPPEGDSRAIRVSPAPPPLSGSPSPAAA